MVLFVDLYEIIRKLFISENFELTQKVGKG
jgi:hypothetical protein